MGTMVVATSTGGCEDKMTYAGNAPSHIVVSDP